MNWKKGPSSYLPLGFLSSCPVCTALFPLNIPVAGSSHFICFKCYFLKILWTLYYSFTLHPVPFFFKHNPLVLICLFALFLSVSLTRMQPPWEKWLFIYSALKTNNSRDKWLRVTKNPTGWFESGLCHLQNIRQVSYRFWVLSIKRAMIQHGLHELMYVNCLTYN